MEEEILQLFYSNIISIVATVIAVCSLIISIIGIIVQKKINETNLEAKYYEKIFDTYILEIIPNTFFKLQFDSKGKINKEYKELNNVMMNMVKEAKYFSFSNPKFFKGLTDKTKTLEDKLLDISNKTFLQNTEQKEQLVKIEDEISKIIVYINKNYNQSY